LLDGSTYDIGAGTQFQSWLKEQLEVQVTGLRIALTGYTEKIGATDQVLELSNTQTSHDFTNLDKRLEMSISLGNIINSSLTSSASMKKKLITCSGFPVNFLRSSGSWVAIPTGQVFK